MEVRLDDLRADYVSLCRMVKNVGNTVMVRGQETRELTGITLIAPDSTVDMLPRGVGRGIDQRSIALDALGLIGGVWAHDLDSLADPDYSDIVSDRTAQTIAYGPRTVDYATEILEQLHDDPTSRQAVLSIWQVGDLTRVGDKPCALSLQFLLRDGLECHVSSRSQDVWFDLARDVFMFTQLQHSLAYTLGTRSGRYVHHIGSLHAHTYDFEYIDQLYFPTGDIQRRLPLGLKVPDHVVPPFNLARDLLNRPERVTAQARALNPWYSDQLTRLYSTDESVR